MDDTTHKDMYRPLTPTDEPLLWNMLYHALFVPLGEADFPREIVEHPSIRRYVEGWGRAGDMGFKAVIGADDQAVGACWLRLWPGDDRGFGFVEPETPELSIAVLPQRRGQGIGTELLRRTLEAAADHYAAVSLSVTSTNPAVRLYRRTGFETVDENDGSLVMRCRLVDRQTGGHDGRMHERMLRGEIQHPFRSP